MIGDFMNQNEMRNAETWVKILFDKFFEEKIKQGGYIKSWIAIVDTYDSTNLVADVHLPNDTTNLITNIKNKSGVSLVAGDIVELHSRLGVLGSSYIAVKY